MKVKTSVTLSEDLLAVIDQRAKQFNGRSGFIEAAVRSYVAQKLREQQNAADLEILNRRAERLNKEAADVLRYQIPL